MKVENDTTGHNRTLRFTNLPKLMSNELSEVVVTICCVSKHNEPGVLAKAMALDKIIIPSIIEAINDRYDK